MPGSHVSVGESKLCHRTRPLGAERIRLPESRSLRERFDEVLKVGAVLQRVVLEWVRINEPVWVKWRLEGNFDWSHTFREGKKVADKVSKTMIIRLRIN